jgi:hypothetical protein
MLRKVTGTVFVGLTTLMARWMFRYAMADKLALLCIREGQDMESRIFQRESRSQQLIALTGAMAIILTCSGCFLFDEGDFDNIDFKGYIRWSTDSTGVPNAAIHIENVTEYDREKAESRDFYADENGYFDERITIPANALTSQVPEREWLFTTYDADSTEHGVFVSVDTLLIEVDPQHVFKTQFLFDLYVDELVTVPVGLD